MHKRFFTLINILALLIGTSGCQKLVDIDPPENALTSDNVYSDDGSAASVLTGIYAALSDENPLGSDIDSRAVTGMGIRAGLSADELSLYSGTSSSLTWLAPYYLNQLSAAPTMTIWDGFYGRIYESNLAIERLTTSKLLTPAVRRQLLGEAKFLRAFYYFYLVNLFGNVPLVLESDYRKVVNLAKSPKAEIYNQMVLDLKDAQANLSEKFLKEDAITPYSIGLEERVRPTRWAATALLARVHLFRKEWAEAEQQASSLIAATGLFSLPALDSVFLKNSPEAIFQLQPVKQGYNTSEARLFNLPDTGPDGFTFPFTLDSINLVKKFTPLDNRRNQWIGSVVNSNGETFYFPHKYKVWQFGEPVTEYQMVLRLAEQLLIRSEARANLNNISGAQADFNKVRNRAGLPDTNTSDKETLLRAILQERQLELFTEWGHRWLDLKRTDKIDSIMAPVAAAKGGSWQTTDQLYPIPQFDIQNNPNIKQNPGY